MSTTETQDSTKRTFWTTWQVFVGVPGIFLIGWMLLGPDELAFTGGQVLAAWLTIFAVAAVAGLIRSKSTR
ncbi:hypothetical protein BCL67_11291 [Nesterenkonia sandarakina]|uniref:Uncharacterized protein n=1 Tax=Nesterenkonia sandarakina TaxID=272918 RepID=A0A2T0YGT4_9MICC|nr:hypothetical protein BCL67_11291 [Nesterenkonia sandarakina]